VHKVIRTRSSDWELQDNLGIREGFAFAQEPDPGGFKGAMKDNAAHFEFAPYQIKRGSYQFL